MATNKVKGVSYDVANGEWIHRQQISGKRVKTVLLKIEYPKGQIPKEPPPEALEKIPGGLPNKQIKPPPPLASTPLTEFVGKWMDEVNHGAKKTTVKQRKIAIDAFLAYCQSEGLTNLDQIRNPQMRGFVNWLRNGGGKKGDLKDSSIKCMLGYIGALFSQAIDDYIYPYVNPIKSARKRLNVVKEEKPKSYTKAEVAALLTVLKEKGPEWLHDIQAWMYYTGMRIDATLNLRFNWATEPTEGALVGLLEIPVKFSKGKKPIHTTLRPEARKILERRAKARGIAPYTSQEKVFPEPIAGESSVYQMTRARIRKAGLADYGRYCHIMRHSYAVHAQADGIDLVQLQTALGHSSVVITQNFYAPPTTDKMLDGFERLARMRAQQAQ